MRHPHDPSSSGSELGTPKCGVDSGFWENFGEKPLVAGQPIPEEWSRKIDCLTHPVTYLSKSGGKDPPLCGRLMLSNTVSVSGFCWVGEGLGCSIWVFPERLGGRGGLDAISEDLSVNKPPGRGVCSNILGAQCTSGVQH